MKLRIAHPLSRSLALVSLLAACANAPLAGSQAPQADAAAAAPQVAPARIEVGSHTSDPSGFDTTTYWVDTGEEVVVFDAQFTLDHARAAIEAIRRETDSPIRYLVVTHPNPDKFNGAAAFREVGAEIVASKATAEAIPGVHAYKRAFFVDVAKMMPADSYPAEPTVDIEFEDELRLPTKAGSVVLRELVHPGVSSTQTVAFVPRVRAVVHEVADEQAATTRRSPSGSRRSSPTAPSATSSSTASMASPGRSRKSRDGARRRCSPRYATSPWRVGQLATKHVTCAPSMSSRLITIVVASCVIVACADEPGDEDGTPGAGGSTNGGGGQHQQGGGGDGGMTGGGDAGGDGGMGGSIDEGVDLGGGVTVIPTKLEPGGAAKVIYRGSLSDGEVRLRHGFNGWNSTTGARSSEDDGQGNLDFYIDVPMTPLADGTGHEATIDVPGQARALHMAFSTPDGQSWDNNDSKDYNRGVRFPYLGPYLTWSATTSPESGVVVHFHTGHECQGSVDFGPTAALGSTIAEPSESRSHHIALTGLAPGGAVYYRVACGTLVEETVHRFDTAPAVGNAFTFVALGDMQDAGENGRWGDVAEAVMQQHPESAFLVVSGDMAHNDRPGLWWTFFDKGYELFASKVIMPAAGNHDTPGVNSSPDTTSFEQYFPMDAGSGSPTYYQFSYANAHFIALNSERVGEFAVSGGAQYQWTQQAVANAANAAWGFAFWHIPPYNAGNGHWSQQGDVRDMTALFEGSVDWVLCGHEHLYQRTKPLRYNGQLVASYGRGDNDGVGYMVVPPAGVWPRDALIPHDDPKGYYRDRLAYPVVAPPSNTAPSELGFVAVAVDGPTITLTTYGLGTIASPAALHVVDQHSYSKP